MAIFSRAFLLASCAALAVVAAPRRQANVGGSNVQVIDVTAKKYEFDPSPIHVKQGTKVELRITALDHRHGFSIQLTPLGSGKNAAPGLVFDTPRKCWNLPQGKNDERRFRREDCRHVSFPLLPLLRFRPQADEG